MTLAENSELIKTKISVCIKATDNVLRIGISNLLNACEGLNFFLTDDPKQAAVAVVVVDRLNQEAIQIIRETIDNKCQAVVLAGVVDDLGILSAIEAGASSVIMRQDVSCEQLSDVVTSAYKGYGALSSQLLNVLITRLGIVERNFLRPSGKRQGFTERELDILKLLADGFDTSEIAFRLAYSERTVKKILHDITTRFQLKNRCHAVAYALRNGII
ncbi:MAG: response regulator transcription factor [Firmicutes bacterium]|jgi:DNA-binding NarL/FixJ family response regulator|nr:response regulator transcription factor [Bacillota bacterium]